MSRSLLLLLCLVIGLLVLACGGYENRNAASTAPSSTPAASPRASAAATVAAGGQVGVVECDNFITAYENCVSTKVPEQARAQLKEAVTRWRTEWKKLADNPQTRGTLASACKTQLEATRTQMKPYGCTF